MKNVTEFIRWLFSGDAPEWVEVATAGVGIVLGVLAFVTFFWLLIEHTMVVFWLVIGLCVWLMWLAYREFLRRGGQ